MSQGHAARPTGRRIRVRRILFAGLLVAIAAIAAALGSQLPASSSPAASSSPPAPSSIEVARGGHRGALGEADGAVPDGTTVFDVEVPGVANLDADLLAALRRAATDAARDGVAFHVDSGWRSPEYQARLLREAVAEYGSAEEAARWVATPETSLHVSGDAVDIGRAASEWLSEHGAAYGLCRVYGNEPWHYELRPEAAAGLGCPPTYADPTHDPRLAG